MARVENVQDRLLLLAYVAAESDSLARALGALYESDLIASGHRDRAMLQADAASWSFCLELGAGAEDEPDDRLVRVRAYLTEHTAELILAREGW